MLGGDDLRLKASYHADPAAADTLTDHVAAMKTFHALAVAIEVLHPQVAIVRREDRGADIAGEENPRAGIPQAETTDRVHEVRGDQLQLHARQCDDATPVIDRGEAALV